MTGTSEETAELSEGRTVRVRPIQPDDKRLLADAFQRLSAESRRRRFLTPATELSAEDLAYLTEVDHRRHEAVVAIDPADGSIVGSARYVQVPRERETAEVAVAVVDDWQRRGVATALLSYLSRRARENGIESFRAYVSSENAVVVDALSRAGASRAPSSGASEIEFNVEVPQEGLAERLRVALRAAAAGELDLVGRVRRRLGIWSG
ncbi:MAG TPA: GNAT family N-acetyltransferase [Thermoleophilaceae bacterium]|nr:GNAT family N-acetyltransferase [Thermoleophilaceae bacterium]